MRRWIVLFLLLVFMLGVAGSGYAYSKYKTYNDLVRFDKSEIRADTVAGRDYFITQIDEQKEFGIYPQEENNGVTIVSLYGTLNRFYKENEEYKIDLIVGTSKARGATININLGGENVPITHLYGETTKENSLIPGTQEKKVINEIFARSSAKEMYDTYQALTNLPYRIDIMVANTNPKPKECDERCESSVEQYSKYSETNALLLSKDVDLQNLGEIGSVRLISISK